MCCRLHFSDEFEIHFHASDFLAIPSPAQTTQQYRVFPVFLPYLAGKHGLIYCHVLFSRLPYILVFFFPQISLGKKKKEGKTQPNNHPQPPQTNKPTNQTPNPNNNPTSNGHFPPEKMTELNNGAFSHFPSAPVSLCLSPWNYWSHKAITFLIGSHFPHCPPHCTSKHFYINVKTKNITALTMQFLFLFEGWQIILWVEDG